MDVSNTMLKFIDKNQVLWSEVLKKADKILILLAILLSSGFFYPGEVSCGDFSKDIHKYSVRIVEEIPRRMGGFTQGLLYYKGMLYESNGLVGKSSLRKINAQTGSVEKVLKIPEVFAEGLARWENRLIQLTWKSRTAFVYDIDDFSKKEVFAYETEGWGLTSDDRHLIMSDGTDRIYFRNPYSFKVEKTINVRYHNEPLYLINELEYADGFIYANIWYRNFLIKIQPEDGAVAGKIDCRALLQRLPPLGDESVLNGIAYDPETKFFYLTGKHWPRIFKVDFVP